MYEMFFLRALMQITFCWFLSLFCYYQVWRCGRTGGVRLLQPPERICILPFFFVHSFPETMICGGKNTVIFFSRCVAMFVLSCYINYRRHWFYRKRCIYE